MQAYILTIGDEILIGQITDTNSGWMARVLEPLGIPIVGKMAVRDTKEDILDGLRYAEAHGNIVLITGGLGPTKDDLTVYALAEYFNTPLTFSKLAFEHIQARLSQYNVEVSELHHQQSILPEKADLLENREGTAMGMWFQERNTIFVSLPGVPREMKNIMTHQVLPRLKQLRGGTPIQYSTFLVPGIPESELADKLGDFEAQLPDFLSLAYLPKFGLIRLRLGGQHAEQQVLAQAIQEQSEQLKKYLGYLIAADQDVTLAEAIGNELTQKGWTLATAESCTGGYLAHLITANSGSSAYYKGSIIAYANEVKENLLGVQPKTLREHGAVSEATVKEMAAGARQKLNTDLAIAISGIAGPTGGTPEKPVGTIWLAVASKEEIFTKKLQLSKNRLKNIEFSSVWALNFLRKRFLIPKEE